MSCTTTTFTFEDPSRPGGRFDEHSTYRSEVPTRVVVEVGCVAPTQPYRVEWQVIADLHHEPGAVQRRIASWYVEEYREGLGDLTADGVPDFARVTMYEQGEGGQWVLRSGGYSRAEGFVRAADPAWQPQRHEIVVKIDAWGRLYFDVATGHPLASWEEVRPTGRRLEHVHVVSVAQAREIVMDIAREVGCSSRSAGYAMPGHDVMGHLWDHLPDGHVAITQYNLDRAREALIGLAREEADHRAMLRPGYYQYRDEVHRQRKREDAARGEIRPSFDQPLTWGVPL